MKEITNSRYIQASIAAAILAATLLLLIGLDSEAFATHTATRTMYTCQDNQAACTTYVGTSWQKISNAKASGGTYHKSTSTTNAAVFTASSGPEIDLVTITGPRMGKAKVLVFDILAGKLVKTVTFDLVTSSTQYKVMKRITGLDTNKSYALLVVSANGKPVAVDAFKYSQASPPTPPPTTDGSVPPPPEA